jgi:hypothetical protein
MLAGTNTLAYSVTALVKKARVFDPFIIVFHLCLCILSVLPLGTIVMLKSFKKAIIFVPNLIFAIKATIVFWL